MLIDILTIWRREMQKLVADPAHVVITIVRALIIIFIVGTGLNRIVAVPGIQGNYTGFFGPGLIGVTAIGLSMQVGVSVIRDKNGIIKNILVAPISRAALLIGQILGELTDQIVTLVVALAILLFLIDAPMQGIAMVVPILALIITGFASLGVISALYFKSPKSYSAFVTFIFAPLVFLSGAFFPLETFPYTLRIIGLFNPLTYGVDALRWAIFGQSTLGLPFDMVILLPFAAVFFGTAWWLFENKEIKTW